MRTKYMIPFAIIIVALSSGISYYFGKQSNNKQNIDLLSTKEGWDEVPVYVREIIAANSIDYVNWKSLKANEARKLLTPLLDASDVPYGDLVVPSKVVHSGRYLISQWQRSAVGATVIVLGTDKDGDLCVALGAQRGALKHPQGFMELGLPKDDLTLLRDKGASRMNSKIQEIVPMDKSIEDNAVREIYEEIGLKITKDQLKLLSIFSDMNSSPVCIAANYLVQIDKTSDLNTIDEEFVDDDLAKPQWVKIKNIKKDQDRYFLPDNPLAIDPSTIRVLNEALVLLKLKQL